MTGQGGGGGVVTLADGSAIAARPVTGGSPFPAGRTPPGRVRGTGIHYARPLMDTRLWAGKPQRSGSRQFGRTSVSDIVVFPARGAVPRQWSEGKRAAS